ncbi:universal stress protein [Nitratireductor basaltis]|uniref:UspA n=1 Tax=Nitratireductor basaltis TaxID=472175 RepID=A0A084UA56_9HYPH|nr:universal stress protein [Nitratireductor basaltis]KFB09842.1 UspA [Nitratireductor basaltis]
MSYRTILGILHRQGSASGLLDYALPFVARHEAHLIGLHARALPITAASPLGMPIIDPGLMHPEDDGELRELFERRAKAEGVLHEWRSYETVAGDAAISGIESARSCDLVMAAQNDPDADAQEKSDLEALLFETGRPVLLVPHGMKPAKTAAPKRIMLAWNGSRQATRAAFDALPLMREAQNVEVLVLDTMDTLRQDASMAGTAIAEALSRHRIDVTVRTEESAGRSQYQAMNDCVAESGADLLVMGAFARGRISEMIFGGLTHDMLRNMTVPTLMAH